MKELFHFNAKDYPYVEWSELVPKSCSRLLMPGATLASVQAGFGDMLFQGKPRPLFSAWMSDYDIRHSFTGFSSLNYRSLEFTALVKNDIYYQQHPFAGRDHRQYEINLTHTMYMESKVRLQQGIHYSTFDIHYELEAFELLMNIIPELVYPFLNDYYAGKMIQLFGRETYPNQRIVDLLKPIIRTAIKEENPSPLFDIRGILLLAQIFLWHAEITQRRGLSDTQLGVSFMINRVIADLKMVDAPFKGINYYAEFAGMSPTFLKKYFREETGVTTYDFWQSERLEEAYSRLTSSDDPIKSIALESGFGTIPGFYKAFKKKYNEMPQEVRNKMGNIF